MALGTNNTTTTTAAVFIPELWSDDVIAAYKSNLVLANLVTRIKHKGKKGDTIHIPTPTRGSATTKTQGNQVTLIAPTDTEKTITINKWYEYSRLMEDIVSTQALTSLRRFYTDDAGYALAKQVDTDLHALGATLNGGTAYSAAVIGSDGSTAWDGSASTSTGNGAALADAGIRKMIQTLDDLDAPMAGRALVIPPVEKKNLLGADSGRFVRYDIVGEGGKSNSIRTGYIGDVYGVPVYVSTNCPTIQADDSSTNYRVGLLLTKDAFGFAEQMGVRTQTQYKQEYLADLFTADTIYGVGELRDTGGVAFVVPA